MPVARQFAACFRPSRYHSSTAPGAGLGARQVKTLLSPSRSVHTASRCPSMVGPSSPSPAREPAARQSRSGVSLPEPHAGSQSGLTCETEHREAEQQQRRQQQASEGSPQDAP